MSATSTILAQRDKAGTPITLGRWHAGFTEVKNYAVNNGLPLLAIWTNGEECSHCKKLERCLAQSVFKGWMKDSGIVFYFGCNEDKSSDDKYGGKGYKWCWKNESLNLFPFVRFYWKAKKGTVLADGSIVDADKVLIDKAIIGDKFDDYKDKADGAKYAVSYAKKIYKQYVPACIDCKPEGEDAPDEQAYKIRFNESITVAQVNKMLDKIDANDGYCPCQPGKSEDTKCHCKDLRVNKGIGEPCICNIYVKQAM